MATAQEWRERGNAFHTRKEHARAVECYTSAIDLDPNDANAYIERGELYRAMGEMDKAEADFIKAASLTPQGNAADRSSLQ